MYRCFWILLMIVCIGCGDEGFVSEITAPVEHAPAAPSWQPDAITIDALIFPYAAKQAVGQHDIIGEEFLLATCEVLYRNRRVRRSERDNRWVRLSTGQSPTHATRWTHDGVPQFLYIFLNFETESDFQKFQVGTYENVPVVVRSTHKRKANTWQLTLDYKATQQGTTPSLTDATVTSDSGEQVATDTEWLTLERLVSLSAAENLTGVRKVLTTGVEVAADHTDYVRVVPLEDGRPTVLDSGVRVFIYNTPPKRLNEGVHYYYLHVEVDTYTGTALWLRYVP